MQACKQPSGTGFTCTANSVGQPDKMGGDRRGSKGTGGAPPYLVHFDDGHTGLVFPGPDAVVGGAPRRKAGAGRAKKAGR